ncbi:copper-binding protein [Tundrisphaera sp. TA3]|uniref:copper-binding protein n=1 Tax=Tundrisphaera sp. TA3 TaxID=3435775 RepID=UPI003EBDFA7F
MARRLIVAIALGLAAAPGCEKPTPRAETPASPGAKTYQLTGVVRKVDQASGEVVIAHDEIPGFMPAMTMPFTLGDKSLLDDVRPGDEVEAPLNVVFDESGKARDYKLGGLTVSKPAPETAVSTDPPRPESAVLKIADPVPDFAVTLEDGSSARLSDFKGNVVVLTFIYTRCPLPDFCPAVDAKFAEMARQLSALPGRSDRVRLLSISFDPEHDDPAALRAHARRVGARAPLWQFAVASHDELRKVAEPLGLSYAPAGREIIHNLCTAVIGPDGRLARLEAGSQGRRWPPEEMLKAIREAGQASEARP